MKVVIVTGANAAYFDGLANLVGSVHYWSPGTTIEVYDLGLTPRQLDEIDCWRDTALRWAGTGPPVVVRTRGRWMRCPHMRAPKKYAWKAPAMLDAIGRHEAILWLDAGSDVRAPLDPVVRELAEHGCFLVRGQDVDMTVRLKAATYRCLGVERERFVGLHSYAGNTQGYVRGSAAHRDILIPLHEWSCVPEAIAPFGSTTRNHRFDQALLSLIAYSLAEAPRHRTDLLCADRSELPEDPRVPADKVIFTARRSSPEYREHLIRTEAGP